MEFKTRGDAANRARRRPRHSPRIVLRRLAGLGLLVGLGGTLLLERLVGTATACRFAVGFGVTFVLTWGLKAWQHRS